MHFLLSKCQMAHIKSGVNADKYCVFSDWGVNTALTLMPSVCCVFLFRQLYHTTQCTLSNSDIRWQDKFNGTFDTIFLLFTDQWQGVSRSFQKSPYRAKKYALRESLVNDIDTPCTDRNFGWIKKRKSYMILHLSSP